MMNDLPDTTTVTRSTGNKDPSEMPAMSYTAVTSHKTMAEALVKRLLTHASAYIQDRELAAADLVKICQLAMDGPEETVRVLEGRHIRSRITEQLSRAERYKETFSLVSMSLPAELDDVAHDSVTDALIERMRQTDLLFIFNFKLMLLLPHTPKDGAAHFIDRVRALLDGACAKDPHISYRSLTYPDPSISRRAEVLDWAEDQLRA